MKIIFLDVDGVLNDLSDNFYLDREIISEQFVQNLALLVYSTNSKIVLSSSWRIGFKKQDGKLVPFNDDQKYLIYMLSLYNLEIFDVTDNLNINHSRPHEIRKYIKEHDVENYVILDDENDEYKEMSDHFVYTRDKDNLGFKNTHRCGLTIDKVYQAIDILNKEKLC